MSAVFCYDLNGSMTQQIEGNDTYIFFYDAENRLETGEKNGVMLASYTYDGDGKRVKAVEGGFTTYYIGDYYEWREGPTTTAVKYYYATGQRIAMWQGGTLTWLLGDHLGSATITATENGTLASEQKYTAWGQTRSGSVSTDRQYTGQFSEPQLGIYFYNARFYDSYLNRFLSPDTIVPDPYDPLSYDRYMYARNNPIRYSDPSGHDIWDTVGQFAAGFVYEFARTTAWYSPQAQEALAISTSESDAMLVGRIAADVATIVVGVSEFSGGLTVAGGGVIAGCAATLCIASPAAAAVGAGVAAVGASTATAGAVGLGGNLALIKRNGGSGLPTGSSFTIEDLVNSANQPDRNGFTYAGRALQKHGSRSGSTFPNVVGKPTQFNSLGSSIVEEILNNPGSIFTNVNRKGYGDVLEVISPDGRGIRYNATTGEFIGFLEP